LVQLPDLALQTKVKQLFSAMLSQLGLIKRDSQRLSAIPLTERLKVALSAFMALFIVTWISLQLAGTGADIVLLASMGASAVLLFGLPNSPLAKPWSFAGGHLISATVGLICSHLFTDLALMAAVTIGIVLFVMYIFECIRLAEPLRWYR
jgi:CBS domain-containing membrane protein